MDLHMAQESQLKRIPYGEASFVTLRQEVSAYVDKTKFIERLEDSGKKFIFIVRPRRFGKTLFAGMLATYYDKALSNEFDKYFANTYIATNKTALANSFYILRFDFSGVAVGTVVDIVQLFIQKIRVGIRAFTLRYNLPDIKALLDRQYTTPAELFDEFASIVMEYTGKKIYVIIDEYDQFTNEVLAVDKQGFKAITSSEGFLKSFYASLKTATNDDGPVARIFITGVTSISLDSMSSGFNIAKNITNEYKYNAMFGFTSSELKKLITQVIDLKKYGQTLEDIHSRMKELYNGYRFSPDCKIPVFNASMCLFYLDAIRQTNKEPSKLLDPAFSQDLSKIHGILNLADQNTVKQIIHASLKREKIIFPAISDVININNTNSLSKADVLSVLVYMGFLTWDETGKCLVVPNRTVNQQFFEYYLNFVRNFKDFNVTASYLEHAFEELKDGKPQRFLTEVSTTLQNTTGIHSSSHLKESDFCTALATAANFSQNFRPALEYEVRGAKQGYVDLVLIPVANCNYSYAFEIKYLPKSKASLVAINLKLDEAKKQLTNYSKSEQLRTLPNLIMVAVIYVGTGLEHFEVLPIA